VAANGVVLDPMIRACVRRFVKASSLQPLPNPFAAESIPDFELWLDEHVGAHWRLVPTGVRQLWHTNRDLQDRFPDPCGRDAFDLLTWASKNRWVSAADQDRCRDGLAHLTKKSRDLLPVGFNVVGYLTAGMGLGEASRRLTDTLSGTGLPVHVIGQPIHHGSARNDIDRPIHNSIRYTNSLVAVNANSALEVCRRLGIGRNPLGRTVGLWFWELETFPEEFAGACEPFDEIWTASDFMRDAIRRVAPIPVHTMKLEIPVIDRDNLPTRNDVGFDDRFTYFFTYDANSIFHRKNPLGLIAAYRHAFYSQNDARLVIRVLNAWRFPNDFAALIDATADRRDIDIVAASRSAAVARAEIAHADCFVSLHRSEGFGLNIATAAAAGTPVIATNYSGCTDFLDPAGSWLTPFRRVRVGEGSEPYSAQAWWAEPDHDHAVAHIRDVYESADARDRAQKARDFIAEHYSHRRAVARMGDLLGIETRHG